MPNNQSSLFKICLFKIEREDVKKKQEEWKAEVTKHMLGVGNPKGFMPKMD